MIKLITQYKNDNRKPGSYYDGAKVADLFVLMFEKRCIKSQAPFINGNKVMKGWEEPGVPWLNSFRLELIYE